MGQNVLSGSMTTFTCIGSTEELDLTRVITFQNLSLANELHMRLGQPFHQLHQHFYHSWAVHLPIPFDLVPVNNGSQRHHILVCQLNVSALPIFLHSLDPPGPWNWN